MTSGAKLQNLMWAFEKTKTYKGGCVLCEAKEQNIEAYEKTK
jgi:hypothetical protein